MKVGDIVKYINDWKDDREWYLYELLPNNLCTIVLIRDGSYTNVKGGEERLNASIVNLPIDKIRIID